MLELFIITDLPIWYTLNYPDTHYAAKIQAQPPASVPSMEGTLAAWRLPRYVVLKRELCDHYFFCFCSCLSS